MREFAVKNKLLSLLALSGLLLAGTAHAEGFGLGVKAGTLGVGVEGTFGLSKRFNLRAGVNSYSYSTDETASDIRYDAELDLQSAAVLLDWHPFAGAFRLSAGYVHNKNALRVTGTTTSVGSGNYPAGVTVTGDVTFKKNVPYAGIGWGNAARPGFIGMSFEVGAVFQGTPTVRLSGSGVSEADLREEEQQAQADLDDFEIYPVVSFGLSFRF